MLILTVNIYTMYSQTTIIYSLGPDEIVWIVIQRIQNMDINEEQNFLSYL